MLVGEVGVRSSPQPAIFALSNHSAQYVAEPLVCPNAPYLVRNATIFQSLCIAGVEGISCSAHIPSSLPQSGQCVLSSLSVHEKPHLAHVHSHTVIVSLPLSSLVLQPLFISPPLLLRQSPLHVTENSRSQVPHVPERVTGLVTPGSCPR